MSGIESVRAAVIKVAGEWQPGDLPRLEAARITLETSLPGLRESLGNIPSDVRLRSAAEGLRKAVAHLEFLVDAAAAFVRAAASEQGQIYNRAGEPGPEAPAASTAVYTG